MLSPKRANGTTLVTGASGLIGSVVARRLVESGLEVRLADRRDSADDLVSEGCEVWNGDLLDREHAVAAVAGCSHVIHCAALVGGIANWHGIPHTVIDENARLTSNLVCGALAEGVERFTYVSSSAVYDGAWKFPTPEDHLDECPPPRSAYGRSKWFGEALTGAAHEEHGLPYTICRPFNAYGNERPDVPGVSHVVTDLTAKALRGESPLEIFGSGEQTRTFTHVDDVAAGIVTATFADAGLREAFNIAAAEETSIAALAREIWLACGQDRERFSLAHLPAYEHDVQRRWPSVDKARQLLGWTAEIELADGLRRTVERVARLAAP